MTNSDLYAVLQVAPLAEPEVIKAAYRALARKHHPDAGGDEHRMAAINGAWDILGRPDLRAAYDAEQTRTAAAPIDHGQEVGRGPEPGAAGRRDRRPPPGTGPVLDFGRYAGWSIGSLAVADPDYLEWLARTPIGRSLKHQIDAALSAQAAAAAALRPPVPTRSSRRPFAARFAR